MRLQWLQAIVTSGFQPRRAAGANQATSLRTAYLAHWISLIAGATAWTALLLRDPVIGPDVQRFLSGEAFPRSTNAFVFLMVVLSVELAFGMLVLLLLPWGDARAPVVAVWRHALRTAWLHTGHLAIALLPFVAVTVANDIWFFSRGLDWFEPWPFAGGAVWYVTALIRAMTIELPPTESNPPMCEGCGYNLSYHQEPGARCPECGRPVEQSLSPNLRGPVAWGPLADGPCRTGFAGAMTSAWFNPEAFFSSVSRTTGLTQAGCFLLLQMALTGSGFFLATLGGTTVVDSRIPDSTVVYILVWVSAFVSCLCAVGVSITAATIGLIVSKQQGRNCVGGCLRVACYCAGIVPPWVFCQMATGFAVSEIVTSLRAYWLFRFVVPLAFLGLAVTLIVFYVGGVARRMRYIQYANT